MLVVILFENIYESLAPQLLVNIIAYK